MRRLRDNGMKDIQKEILEEAERRAHEKIKEGVLLREMNMRLILREVIQEKLKGVDCNDG